MEIKIKNKTPNKWPQKVPIRRGSPMVYKRKQKKTLKQLASLALVLCTTLLLLIMIGVVFADTKPVAPKYSDSICNTDKCKARVARLNTCNLSDSDNVLDCTLRMTLRASEHSLSIEIKQLEIEAGRKPKKAIETWKQTTINLTVSKEHFSATAYCDKLVPFTRANGTKGLKKACYTGRERYSNWYWTLSYKWAPLITKAQAWKKMEEEFENNFFPIVENTTCWTDNQKSAIADFAYNSGASVKHANTWIPFKSYVSSCNYKEVLWFMDYWLYSGGVIDRKKAERLLFLK